jgi:AcrR family transcriptional regulator
MPTPSAAVSALPERSRATKQRLLDAAEQLFAERGFEGTSLRAVTQAAGASVSAANYHFGSKESLLRATLLRRVEPVNRRRLERLDELERGASGEPPGVEAILDAFLRPTIEVRSASAEGAAQYRQVAARLYSDPPEIVSALARDLFQPIRDRFVVALARALPQRGHDEILVALHFTVGVMVHVIAGHLDPPPADDGAAVRLSDEALLQRLVAYTAAGLRACGARA